MTSDDKARAHATLNYLNKIIEKRLKTLRMPLLSEAGKKGENVVGVDSQPTGSKRMTVDGYRVYDKVTVTKEPDSIKLDQLLSLRGIRKEEVYDKVYELVFSPSKVKRLIDHGYLKQAEIDELRTTTHALTVDPIGEKKHQLETMFESLIVDR